MNSEQALWEIKRIFDSDDDLIDQWHWIKDVIKEYYAQIPPDIKFCFYDEDEWWEEIFFDENGLAQTGCTRPYIFLFTDNGSTHELGIDGMISKLLPPEYNLAMESTIEGPEVAGKYRVREVRERVISDLESLGFEYVPERDQ